MVIFAAADRRDKFHSDAIAHLNLLGRRTSIATSALLEFDVVLKSRGFGGAWRREEWKRMVGEFPRSVAAVRPILPTTFYLASEMEDGYGLDYFDSLVAAEALSLDGQVVSSDGAYDEVPGLKRIPLKED